MTRHDGEHSHGDVTQEARESLVVMLARFDRRHGQTMNIVALLGILSVVVAWKGGLDLPNNLLASALALIGVVGLLGRSIVRLVAYFDAPIGFAHSIKYLPTDPNAARTRRYRFVRPRVGRASDDLGPYVALAAGNVTIAGAHADLDLEGRSRLYQTWLQINEHSFLSLQARMWTGRWRTIAVSIVLPLTPQGADKFRGGSVDVLMLDEFHIAATGATTASLLLDTLIVETQFKARTKGYGFPGLTIRHVAEFWDGSADVRFFVEPDSLKITAKILGPLKFERIRARSGNPSELYEFCYPAHLGGQESPVYDRICHNVRDSRHWTIYPAI